MVLIRQTMGGKLTNFDIHMIGSYVGGGFVMSISAVFPKSPTARQGAESEFIRSARTRTESKLWSPGIVDTRPPWLCGCYWHSRLRTSGLLGVGGVTALEI